MNKRGRARIYRVNENYFDVWSSNMAYILGFIYTDGSINNNSLSIELQERDIEIIEFIKQELCPEAKLFYKTLKKKDGTPKTYVRIRINSIILIKSLKKLGLYSNKSLTIRLGCNIPNIYIKDFLRGAFDGDGWVYCRRNSIESGFVSASKIFLQDIQKLCGGIGQINKKTKKIKNRISTTYTLVMYKQDTLKLRDLIYDKQSFGLKRKRDVFFSEFYIRAPRYWTDEQINILLDNYTKQGNLFVLANKIGKTYKAVSKKIWELQLTER